MSSEPPDDALLERAVDDAMADAVSRVTNDIRTEQDKNAADAEDVLDKFADRVARLDTKLNEVRVGAEKVAPIPGQRELFEKFEDRIVAERASAWAHLRHYFHLRGPWVRELAQEAARARQFKPSRPEPPGRVDSRPDPRPTDTEGPSASTGQTEGEASSD